MTITIPDDSARTIATLLRRLTWEDVFHRAVDVPECERMLAAAEEVRQAIATART